MKKNKFLCAVYILLTSAVCFASSLTPQEAGRIRLQIIEKAKTCLGCPYKTGAVGPAAYDCSGLVYTIYREVAGIQLPRSVKAIYGAIKIVAFEQIEPGDLVFFKTTGNSTISHVGIYISNNEFIHAASDGSNTGVIISSLKEKYYKNTYAGTGKILPSAKTENSGNAEQTSQTNTALPVTDKEQTSDSAKNKKDSFAHNITFDAFLSFDWSLFSPDRFMPNARGCSLDTNARITAWSFQPGIGIGFRWLYATNCFQIPITLNCTYKDIIKLYFGPVITFGSPVNRTYDTQIKAPFFPGVFGICIQTPNLTAGKVLIALVQDFSYTLFVNQDGSAMNFSNGAGAGLAMHTGIRVTLPMRNLLK